MSHPFLVFNRSELFYIITIFILGIIIGSAGLNIFVSREIDQLIYENKELQNSLANNKKQIEELETNLARQKQDFIRGLTIKLETELNKHKQQSIKEKISNLLSGIIGREIDFLDPLLLREIIHERYIILDNNTYQLKLLCLVIQENLTLYISVE